MPSFGFAPLQESALGRQPALSAPTFADVGTPHHRLQPKSMKGGHDLSRRPLSIASGPGALGDRGSALEGLQSAGRAPNPNPICPTVSS